MRIRLPPRAVWTVGLGTTLAFGSWGALPWMIGALIDGAKFRADAAGFLGTLELALMGCCMLVVAPRVPTLNRARLVAYALPAAVGAQIASAFLHDYYWFIAVRAVSGIAVGVLFTVATAEGADAVEPDRAFAESSVFTMCFGVAASLLWGYAQQLYGYRGVFLALSVYYLVAGIPFLLLLSTVRGPVKGERALRSVTKVSVPGAIGVLVVMSMYSIATGGVYAFVERVAHHVGISASALGRGFAVSGLIATLGGTAAARLGLRWGRSIPTLGGLVILGFLSFSVMASADAAGFWESYAAWAVVYWFAYAYIMGLSVVVDPFGRLAAATSSVYLLTGAFGTSLAGVMIQNAGFARFGWTALGICAFGALIAGLVVRHHHSSPVMST